MSSINYSMHTTYRPFTRTSIPHVSQSPSHPFTVLSTYHVICSPCHLFTIMVHAIHLCHPVINSPCHPVTLSSPCHQFTLLVISGNALSSIHHQTYGNPVNVSNNWGANRLPGGQRRKKIR